MNSEKKASIGVGAATGVIAAVAGAPVWGTIVAGVAGVLAAPKIITVISKIFK